MKHFVIFLTVLLLSACGTFDTHKEEAVKGQVADGVTTVLGLTLPGVTELNPFGLATFGIKVGAIAYADSRPPEERKEGMRVLKAIGWGAAAHNTCIIVSVLTANPGTFLGCFFLVGVPTYRYFYNSAEETK